MWSRLKPWSSVLLAIAFAILSGCQSGGAIRSPATPPSLQLTSSASLQLPARCEARSSVFVEFTILPDGATTAIQTPEVPQCLHDALTAWVASFRYSPPGTAVPGSVEWLLVSADKGS